MDVATLFNLLRDADLVDSLGTQAEYMSEGERQRFHLGQIGQAVKYSNSEFSGNDVACYFIYFECYDELSPQNSAEKVTQQFSIDEDIFLAIAGVNWSIAIRRGDEDARIPQGLSELLLDALPSAEVVWALDTPVPEWFEPRFHTSAELASGLTVAGYVLDPTVQVTDQGLQLAEPYIQELAGKGKFAEYILTGFHEGKPVTVISQLWIEPLNAQGIGIMVDAYFGNDGRDEGLAIGDGWCVRLIRREADDLPYSVLQVFAFDLQNKMNMLSFEASKQSQANTPTNQSKPSTHTEVHIWPETSDELLKIEQFFYNSPVEMEIQNWTDDQLAAWIYGWFALRHDLSGYTWDKHLMATLGERGGAVWDWRNNEKPEAQKVKISRENRDYLASRPLTQESRSYFCPPFQKDDVVEQIVERFARADLLLANRYSDKGIYDRRDDLLWSDQLLIDMTILGFINPSHGSGNEERPYPRAQIDELRSRFNDKTRGTE